MDLDNVNGSEGLGRTWNNDINYSSLGLDALSLLMEIDKLMIHSTVQPLGFGGRGGHGARRGGRGGRARNEYSSRHDGVKQAVQRLFEALERVESETERTELISLLFRFLFYVRSTRVPGKRYRLGFYSLFSCLLESFPKTCMELMDLLPQFGYFGDLDAMVELLESPSDEIVDRLLHVYARALDADCQIVFEKPISEVTLDEARDLNVHLRSLGVEDISEYVRRLHGSLSLASKWVKREGKHNSRHRDRLLQLVYLPPGEVDALHVEDEEAQRRGEKRMLFWRTRFRHTMSALNQLLLVGEMMMCEREKATHRSWSDIPLERAPAGFVLKYRKALANEKLTGHVLPSEAETGNRFPEDPDRVACRKQFIESTLGKKIKGSALDLDRLSKLIGGYLVESRQGFRVSESLSDVDRLVLSQQWNDIVKSIREAIEEKLTAATSNEDPNVEYLDPRNIIPIVDMSGSMSAYHVMLPAIGLGVLSATLSSLPGCMISFSDEPKKTLLDFSDGRDVFDHFITLMDGPRDCSTNIDATYRLLLQMLEENQVNDVDFALLLLTDGQFNEHISHGDAFEHTFLDRIESAFVSKGYHLPRLIFWNLNSRSSGFPATSISRGVQLVNGMSQSLLMQVFTGDYAYVKDEQGRVRVQVDPKESFLRALMHEGYDVVAEKVVSVNEGLSSFPSSSAQDS